MKERFHQDMECILTRSACWNQLFQRFNIFFCHKHKNSKKVQKIHEKGVYQGLDVTAEGWQKTATPRIGGSNLGISIFFRRRDCYDAMLAANEEKRFNYEAERRSKTLWGLNEGVSGETRWMDRQAKVDWLRETISIRFVSRRRLNGWHRARNDMERKFI